LIITDESLYGPADPNNSTDDDDAGSGAGAGVGGSGGGSIAAGGSTGTGEDPPNPLALADGVSITDLDLYQAIRRPVVEDGQPASSDIPIVQGRDATLRVFYATDGSYNGGEVTARFIVEGQDPIERTETLSGTSTHAQLSSTINLAIPGDRITAGMQYRVELLQSADSVSGTNHNASYPATADGGAPLDVAVGGKLLKVMLVPVQHNGTLPDTSPEQVARYDRWFNEQYPVPMVEITVRSSPTNYNGSLGSYNGWSNLLDHITDLRDSDGVPDDQYYYGIHDADGGGLLGLGWIGDANDVWSRAAIGVGWSGETAPETAVHEVGHNHGRDHAPCGVSGDPYYPHAGASIGVWGYRPSDKKLLDPYDYVDFMSYCAPTWISDYNFKAIFQHIKQVDQSPKLAIEPALVDQAWDRVKLIDGVAEWMDPKVMSRPPVGSPIDVTMHTTLGVSSTTARFYRYDHIDGGVVFIHRPQGTPLSQLATKVSVDWGGQQLTASRVLQP